MDVQVKRIEGTLKIVIDGRVFDPIAFRSFRPTKRNITDFYMADVRLMSVLATGLDCTLGIPYSTFGEIWTGTRQYDWGPLDAQIELFLEHAPDAYFNLMFQLDTRPWWLEQNPRCSDSYWNLVEIAAYEKWRTETAEYLQDVVRYVEDKYGDRFFAYSLFCGTSTEWYTNSQSTREEARIRPHPLKEAAFRAYLRDTTVHLPSMDVLEHTTHGVFRHPAADKAALDYWRFHNNVIADTILYFADIFQQVIDHRKLLGLFHGYLIALQGTRLLREGHMGYEKVYRCPDIDMMFAPASYGEARTFAGTSGFLNTIDSLDLHDKLYIHECDHRMSVAPEEVEGVPVVRFGTPLDLRESIMVLRREFVMAVAKGAGLWWFDMFEGWFYSEAIMAEIARMVQIAEQVKRVPARSISQIAVFGDVESMYYVSERARVNDDTLRNQRDQLNRIGAPYDLYTLSDIEDPALDLNRYKLVVFLNAFKISDARKRFIEEQVKTDGKTVLWIYAPGYVTDTGLWAANISACVDMSLAETQATPTIVISRSELLQQLQGQTYGFSEAISPLFAIADEGATVLGHYEGSDQAALGCKPYGTYTSFYSGTGNIPAEVLREVVRTAGVHIYHEGRDPVYVNSRLIGIHAMAGGEVCLHVPHEIEVEDLFEGGTFRSEGTTLRCSVAPGTMKAYLIPGPEMRL